MILYSPVNLNTAIVLCSVHCTPIFKENRIYIRVEFTRKKCKTAILLFCFHTARVLHIFMLYKLWAPEHHFIKNLELIFKENQAGPQNK